MKSLLLLGITLLSFSFAAISQYQFGMKVGMNVANQDRSYSFYPNERTPASDEKPYLGYQAGIFYSKWIQKKWVLSSELNFNVIGSRTGYQTGTMLLNGEEDDFNYKFGYIEWPVMIRYNLNKFYFTLGPAICYKIFSRITSFGNSRGSAKDYRKFDYSANILSGFTLSKNLDINVRYSYGLKNIETSSAYDFTTKNRFFNLSLLYALNCKQMH